MASIWVESLEREMAQALASLSEAVRDCPDALWVTPMWPVAKPGPEQQFLDEDWRPVMEPDARERLGQAWVERRSAPWSVAWHALECFDYDLNGEFSPWTPLPPFAGHPHWRDLAGLQAPWTREEVQGYIEHCERQSRQVMAAMTEESGRMPLPSAHRYGGQPRAWILQGLVAHTVEHAAQIQQFRSASAGSSQG